MLKPRNPIITTLLSLIAASACHRLPLSIGEGIDDAWNNPDGSGTAGRGGSGTTGTGYGGAAGAPDVGECEADYVSCLESGEEGTLCRGILERCVGGGTAGTGSGGAYPDDTGVAGAGGRGGSGSAGVPGADECYSTYVLCLESGESPEICRDELSRCELSEVGAGGAAGAPGEG